MFCKFPVGMCGAGVVTRGVPCAGAATFGAAPVAPMLTRLEVETEGRAADWLSCWAWEIICFDACRMVACCCGVTAINCCPDWRNCAIVVIMRGAVLAAAAWAASVRGGSAAVPFTRALYVVWNPFAHCAFARFAHRS